MGGSITDALRSGEIDDYFGQGYPALVRSYLEFENPGKHVFFKRVIAGNRIVDLYARIKADIINLCKTSSTRHQSLQKMRIG